MRVLILSAFFAVAAAAPSGIFAPVVLPAVRAVAVPAAVPTISPGDIQAAAIDAEVQARDLAQAAIDKARELAELANENVNEKVTTDVDAIKEKSIEAVWSAQDKNWQALDALKTAEAKIDGIVANNANLYAKSAISGAVPYVAAVGPISPIVAPIPPVVYSSYLAPQAYSTQTVVQNTEVKAEAKEENKEAVVKTAEAVVKTAEPEKAAEPAEAEQGVKVEAAASPAAKAAENLNAKPALLAQPLIASPYGLTNVYRYDVAVPALGQVVAQPLVKYAAVPQIQGVLTPTLVKTVW